MGGEPTGVRGDGGGHRLLRHRLRVVVEDVGMIVEHALLSVRAGQENDFEAAFGQAKSIISAMPGFRGLTLSRGIERPGTYLMLVRWNALRDHTEGFRGSPQYQQWKQLLHHFYDPFPAVEHYEPIQQAEPPAEGLR